MSDVIRTEGDRLRVTGHPEVLEVVTDAERFSSAVSRFLQVPNGLDGQRHRQVREALDPYFSDDRIEALEPRFRQVARELVRHLPREGEVDVVRELGTTYAVRAMLAWLGWDPDLEAELVGWVASNAAATRSGELARTRAVAEHFDDIIRRVIEPRLEEMDQDPVDVTDELLREHVAGEPFEPAEIVSILRNWTGGDLGSLALCVGVVLHQMAADPQIQADIRSRRGDPRALDRAIDELLRIDDPFVANRRVATGDTDIAGCPVSAGRQLVVDWTLANRDPRVFGDVDAYRPEDNASNNIVYGAGPHICPGRTLATLELRILLEEIIDATSHIGLPEGVEGVRAQYPLGGWERRPIRFRHR